MATVADKKMQSLFIVAGEDSADQLGCAIVSALPKGVRSFGLGGGRMREAGFEGLKLDKNKNKNKESNTLAIIGIGDSLTAWPRLNRLADTMIQTILAEKPDAVLTIDSKGFALRFAQRLRAAMEKSNWQAPIIHLVAPSVWAWGSWRAASFAKSFDRVLCLFPFEPRYFAGKYGGGADYVGHPLFARRVLTKSHARKQLGIADDGLVLVLLPGSRKKEVDTLLVDMLDAASRLLDMHPNLTIVLPVARSVKSDIIRILAQHKSKLAAVAKTRLLFADSPPGENITWSALAAGDAAIMCSGTVTLECALNGLHGVAVYRPDWLTMVAGRMLNMNRHNVILANVVAGQVVYDLKLRGEVTGKNMSDAIAPILSASPTTRMRASRAMQARIQKAIKAKDTVFGDRCVAAITATIAKRSVS
ncbi:MAG: lipid-A-disaccharide synthase [Proteobacteria bacterium]|nr:lipid-A-disaccharide synthase [Pseudomonadota bacterium]